MPLPTNPSSVMFDEFELDAETAELRRDGEIVPLRPLATRALLLLASRAGRLTSRQQLREALWDDSHLEWNQALNQCIRQIRSALGDSADSPMFLETVHHRGYRFIASVSRGADRLNETREAVGRPVAGYRMFFAGVAATLAIVIGLMSICIR